MMSSSVLEDPILTTIIPDEDNRFECRNVETVTFKGPVIKYEERWGWGGVGGLVEGV